MEIQLSDHFTYKKLFRYVLPSILMMLVTSTYSIVDGLFVSNFVGKTAFAAVNLIMPLLVGVSSVGFMLGTGGSAIVSMTLGQGKGQLANRYFFHDCVCHLCAGLWLCSTGIFAFSPYCPSFGCFVHRL